MSNPAPPKVDIAVEVAAASKALDPAVKRLTKALAQVDADSLKTMPVGALADLLYDLRQTAKVGKSLASPVDDVLDPIIKLLEEHFVMTLAIGEASGTQGKKARVQITESVVPTVTDWDKFYAHISKTKAFELLNRNLNRASIQERWDARKEVPGVQPFRVKRVSCTKLNGK